MSDRDSVDLGSQREKAIDWVETEKLYGHNQHDIGNSTKLVACKCFKCGQQFSTRYSKLKKRSSPCCNQCIRELSKVKISLSIQQQYVDGGPQDAISAGVRHKWRNDPEFRQRATEANRKNGSVRSKAKSHSDIIKALWRTKEYRATQTAIKSSKEHRRKLSIALSDKWTDDAYRSKVQAASRRLWASTEYRAKAAIALARQPKVSSIQHTLYGMLDDLLISYDREVAIGPWTFDCRLRLPDRNLLIECQGDYWHSLPETIRRDKAKAAYIERYHSEFELKYIWEHEFLCREKVLELLKYWTGISFLELESFEFSDLELRSCAAIEYRHFLSKYHYLANAGRGGTAIGAFLGDELVGLLVFSRLPRQNIQINDYKFSELREISRLCIHPKYQKPNFGSWLISRAIKRLPDPVRCIVAYSDTTFNHIGTVYLATNFVRDAVVRPEYWYISSDGWVMHKKTLYNHAVRMGRREADYAALHGYTKVLGYEKTRFIYER